MNIFCVFWLAIFGAMVSVVVGCSHQRGKESIAYTKFLVKACEDCSEVLALPSKYRLSFNLQSEDIPLVRENTGLRLTIGRENASRMREPRMDVVFLREECSAVLIMHLMLAMESGKRRHFFLSSSADDKNNYRVVMDYSRAKKGKNIYNVSLNDKDIEIGLPFNAQEISFYSYRKDMPLLNFHLGKKII